MKKSIKISLKRMDFNQKIFYITSLIKKEMDYCMEMSIALPWRDITIIIDRDV